MLAVKRLLFPLLTLFSIALADGSPTVRIGPHPGFARVVIDLPQETQYTLEPVGAAMRVVFPGIDLPLETVYADLPELAGYVVQPYDDKTEIIFFTKQGVTDFSGYRASLIPALEGEGLRLVLDFSSGFVNTQPFGAPEIPQAKKAFQVVLDAGHGGTDPGATAFVVEKFTTLKVALQVDEYLKRAGITPIMVRRNDSPISQIKQNDLEARARLADKKDLFVSIHVNAAPPERVNLWSGLEVFYFSRNAEKSTFTQPSSLNISDFAIEATNKEFMPQGPNPLEGIVPPEEFINYNLPQTAQMSSNNRTVQSKNLATTIMSYLLTTTGARDRGVRKADYYVIKYTTVPAVLVEMGYSTHPLEGTALQNENYLNRIAYGIARGIVEDLNRK